jgi:hypothetical protein
MKTKFILESQSNYAKRENKEFDKLLMKSILLALFDEKKISRAQYEECKNRLKIFD